MKTCHLLLPVLCIVFFLAEPLAGDSVRDSPHLIQLVGKAAEMVNGFLDTILRDPLSRALGMQGVRQKSDQRVIGRSESFMCDTRQARSQVPPESVHQLRPGDIDIIAAMGDSLTSANGPSALDPIQMVLNRRGMSWSGGGQGDWRQFLTLPNILKEFNPDLYGYATGSGFSYSRTAGMNVAVAGSITPDLPHQARTLVQRMRQDPRVNMTHHWKVISVMIGSNDICLFTCYEFDKYSPSAHARHLQDALDYLYDHVPRSYVNLILQPELSALRSMASSWFCDLAHLLECPCMFGAGHSEAKIQFTDSMVTLYREAEKALVASGRYGNRTDFTVEIQPFTQDALSHDMMSGSNLDMNLFAVDCFHLSQKGNACAANSLWNNMMEPVGNKSEKWIPEFQTILCPSEDTPYLFTRKNTELFLKTGQQLSENKNPTDNTYDFMSTNNLK